MFCVRKTCKQVVVRVRSKCVSRAWLVDPPHLLKKEEGEENETEQEEGEERKGNQETQQSQTTDRNIETGKEGQGKSRGVFSPRETLCVRERKKKICERGKRERE